jgi:hypothetical protein
VCAGFTDPARKEGILPAAVLQDVRTLKRQQRNAYLLHTVTQHNITVACGLIVAFQSVDLMRCILLLQQKCRQNQGSKFSRSAGRQYLTLVLML